MNLILTCKCGTKFRVSLENAGKEVACPGCGKRAWIPAPKTPPPTPTPEADDEVKLVDLTIPDKAPAAESPPEDEEVRLQELVVPSREDRVVELNPKPKPVVAADEDSDEGYDFDKKSAMSGLETGTGVYGTFAVIRMDEHVPCIAYGSRGEWAIGGQGNDVLIINMKTKKASRFFEEHDDEITAVALSASEPLALSGDDDGVLMLWDAKSLKRKRKINAHKGAVLSVALSLDGKYAASGGTDACINLWDLATGKRLDLEFSDWTEWDEDVTYVAFSRDSKYLLAGGSGGRVSRWDIATGDRKKRYAGLDLPISCLRMSDEGAR